MTWLRNAAIWCLLAVVAAVLIWSASTTGIWDPWEMNRAHLARQVAGRTKVLIIEPDGALSTTLQERLGESLFFQEVAQPEENKAAPGKKAEPSPASRAIQIAEGRLDSEVFHGVVIDGNILKAEPVRGAAFLASLQDRAPGAKVVATAPADSSCDELQTAMDTAMVEDAFSVLKTRYKLNTTDEVPQESLSNWPGKHPFHAMFDCVTQQDEVLVAAVEDMTGSNWTHVVYKGPVEPKGKENTTPSVTTWSAPPLDYWLTAASYKAFGFSEFSTRLPVVIFGMLTLILLLFAVSKLLTSRTAVIAIISLLSIPMFWGQAANMSGEISYTFFLTLCVLVFMKMQKDGFTWRCMAVLLAGSVFLVLAKGLFGLLVLTAITTSYLFAFAQWRNRATLLPAIAIGALLAVLAVVTLLPREWTFFDHFKFMWHGFMGGPQTDSRTFVYMLRTLAFPFLPLAVLVPVALVRLLPMGATEESRNEAKLELLTVLWFLVPFALQAALIPGFAQTLFPAVPAAGLALAMFWNREQQEGKPNRLTALIALAIGLMLLNDAFKSPDPFFSFLASDPLLASDEGATGPKFPADFKLGLVASLLMSLTIFIVFYYYSRLGSAFKAVVRFFRKPVAFWWTFWVVAVALLARLWIGLQSRFGEALASKSAHKLVAEDATFLDDLAYRRPESMVLYGLAGLFAALALIHFSPLSRLLGPALQKRFGDWWNRRVVPVLHSTLIGYVAAALVAFAALVDVLVTVPAPEGLLAQWPATAAFWVAVAALLLPAAGALFRRFVRRQSWRDVLPCIIGGKTVAFILLASSWYRVSDMSAVDIPILVGLSSLILIATTIHSVLSSGRAFHMYGLGLLAAWFVAFLGPMIVQWTSVESIVFPDADPPLLQYLFLESRATLAILAVMALAVLNFVYPCISAPLLRRPFLARILERMGENRPGLWPERIQDQKVFIPLVLALGLASGVASGALVFPSFSKEVSEKHILDIYYEAESRDDLGNNIFKYNKGASEDSEDKNFYTAPIPELTGNVDLTRVLQPHEDSIVRVNRSPSHPGPDAVLLRGFAEENDTNQDGKRDYEAFAGIATDVDGNTVVDANLETPWPPHSLKGKVFIDVKGNIIGIEDNTENSVILTSRPDMVKGKVESMRYIIDDPAAAVHTASAMEKQRNYVIMGQEVFSSVNFTFRSQTEGRHIPVLDSSNASFLLAASYLKDAEQNQNRFAKATLTPEDVEERGRLRGGWVDFDGQLKLLGYEMDTPVVARSTKAVFRLFFEVTAPVKDNWKIFVHLDSTGSSNRIHGDHWPLSLATDPEEKKCIGCYPTNHWRKGDIIVDEFKVEIPLGSPSGTYNINMGLYLPGGSDKRLKVVDYEKGKVHSDASNRVKIGSFEVH